MNAVRALLLATLLLLPSLARAGIPVWQPGGISVCGTECQTSVFFVAEDGSGGVYVAWRESRNVQTSGSDIYLQRILGSGQIAPGWPDDGLPVCTVNGSQNLGGVQADRNGGALVIWSDLRDAATFSSDVYVQRVNADGTIAEGWPENGAAACNWPGSQVTPALIATPGGGAFVAWGDDRDFGL